MRITIARLGPPADRQGTIVAPGAIPSCDVPLLEGFAPALMPIGRAKVHADGTADLELAPGVELVDVDRLEADATIGIGYRVLEQHEENGVRVVDRLELMAVGVSREYIKRGGEGRS